MLENIITVLVHSPTESQNLQSFTSILANCYLINCSVIDAQSRKQCQYKLKTAALVTGQFYALHINASQVLLR